MTQKSDLGQDFGIEKDAGEVFKEGDNLYAYVHNMDMQLHICAHAHWQKSAFSVPTLLFLSHFGIYSILWARTCGNKSKLCTGALCGSIPYNLGTKDLEKGQPGQHSKNFKQKIMHRIDLKDSS